MVITLCSKGWKDIPKPSLFFSLHQFLFRDLGWRNRNWGWGNQQIKKREVSLSLGLFQFDYTAVRGKLKEKRLRNVKLLNNKSNE